MDVDQNSSEMFRKTFVFSAYNVDSPLFYNNECLDTSKTVRV